MLADQRDGLCTQVFALVHEEVEHQPVMLMAINR